MSQGQLSDSDKLRIDNCMTVVKRHLENNDENKAWNWYASMMKAFVKELGNGLPLPPFPGTASLHESMTLLPHRLISGTIRWIVSDYTDGMCSGELKSRYESCLNLLQVLTPGSAHLLPALEEILAAHGAPYSQSATAPRIISNETLARRLARVAADDIRIYNPELIMQGIVEHNLFELLHDHIEESRREFNMRVTPEIAASNIFDSALIDVLVNRAYKK